MEGLSWLTRLSSSLWPDVGCTTTRNKTLQRPLFLPFPIWPLPSLSSCHQIEMQEQPAKWVDKAEQRAHCVSEGGRFVYALCEWWCTHCKTVWGKVYTLPRTAIRCQSYSVLSSPSFARLTLWHQSVLCQRLPSSLLECLTKRCTLCHPMQDSLPFVLLPGPSTSRPPNPHTQCIWSVSLLSLLTSFLFVNPTFGQLVNFIRSNKSSCSFDGPL